MPEQHDILVVGGGPAGSTCARALVAGGARVAVIDRAEGHSYFLVRAGAARRRVHGAMAAARKLRDRIPALAGRSRDASNGAGAGSDRSGSDRSLGRAAIARGFAWMYSGARLPAPRLLDLMLGSGE